MLQLKMKKILLTLPLFFALILYVAGSYLTHPNQVSIGDAPQSLGKVRVVSIPSKSGSILSGWHLPAKQGKGGVLLLHGVRSNRLQMLNRAKFLHNEGYDVLLVDFQAHGESNGSHITFGHLESLDAEAAYNYLEERVCNPSIAVIGVSLGGASALLGKVKERASVLILESVYPTIEDAIKDRLAIYFGSLGHYLSPLLTFQLEPRVGISVDDLRPIDEISKAKGAVLIIAGSTDQHTTLKESKKLFEKAPKPKELWVIEGARHVDFDRFKKEEYQERVLDFLEEWM